MEVHESPRISTDNHGSSLNTSGMNQNVLYFSSPGFSFLPIYLPTHAIMVITTVFSMGFNKLETYYTVKRLGEYVLSKVIILIQQPK